MYVLLEHQVLIIGKHSWGVIGLLKCVRSVRLMFASMVNVRSFSPFIKTRENSFKLNF